MGGPCSHISLSDSLLFDVPCFFDVHGLDETGAVMMLGVLLRRRTLAGLGACR
jgi:hypothetical protein